jgi:NADH:ubiquinone oxidoreductase subunit 5 (subunit L)/multisubunit Na+/H+ antiporter MnhA subunit
MSYVIFFGSMGLPGLCGFVAEVFVVLSAYNYSVVLAVLAASAVILTAGYILWTIQRVFLGGNQTWKGLPDLDLREIAIAVPLVVLTIALGILPQPLVFSWMSPSVDQMVQDVVTARELNIQRGRAQLSPTPARRLDAGIKATSQGHAPPQPAPEGRGETQWAGLAPIPVPMYLAGHVG